MVGHQVDEHVRFDGDRVVAPVLVLGDPRQPVQPRRPVDGEALDLLAELRPVTHEVLRGQTVGELRQHLGELGVDGRAVVALHEVLHDQLPVRRHVVDDPAPQGQAGDVIAVDQVLVPQPLPDRPDHLVLEGGRLLGQADPHVAQVLPDVRLHQRVRLSVDVGHLGQVGCRDQLAVQVVRPGVVHALERPLDLTLRLRAQPHAAVPADVEECPDLAPTVPRDDDALPADLHRTERSRPGEIGGPHRTEPRLLQDRGLLGGEHLGRDVAHPGQGGDQALRDLLTGRGQRRVEDGHRVSKGSKRWRGGRGTGQPTAMGSAGSGAVPRRPGRFPMVAVSCLRQRVKSRGRPTDTTATGSSPRR